MTSSLPIVCINCHGFEVLREKTTPIESLSEGQEIGEQLLATAKSLPRPPAGLAAPQIGISRSVFVFSWDRKPEHLTVVINPSYTPVEQTTVEGFEGCLSAMNVRKIAHIARYTNIEVRYQTPAGTSVHARLTGFAAKVFQHEYDHLQGIMCIEQDKAEVKQFETDQALMDFMTEVKSKDSERYVEPILFSQ